MFNKKVNALEKKITELGTEIEKLRRELQIQEEILEGQTKHNSEFRSLVYFMNEHPQGYYLKRASHLVTGGYNDYLELQWVYRNKLYIKTICTLDENNKTYSAEKDEKLPIFHIFITYEKEGATFTTEWILDERTAALVPASKNEIEN